MTKLLVTSSVLILTVTVLRCLLRGRVSQRLMYALWLLVALRLLVPVSGPESALSILNLFNNETAQTSIEQSDRQEARPVQGDSAGKAAGQGSGAQPAVTVPGLSPVSPIQPGETAREAALPHPADREVPIPWATILRGVWLAGAAGMAIWLIASNLTFRRRLVRSARRVESLDCPVPVLVSAAATSPCLVGLLRPRIYLTPDCLDDPDRLRHVLAHEYTHCRHADHIWALIRCLCLALYWFDPLVWLAAALSRRDCELACDEGALARLGEGERRAYGRTLLSMVTLRSGPAQLGQTATTMSAGARGLRERIVLLSQRPRRLAAAAALALAIALLAVSCTFTAAPAQDGDTAEDLPLESRLSQLPREVADAGVMLLQDGDALDQEGILASFYYQPDYDGEGMGWLCDIVRLTPVEFEQGYTTGWMIGGIEYLGRDDDYYYTYRSATDVRIASEHYEQASAARDCLDAWLEELVSTQPGMGPIEEDPVYQALKHGPSWPGRHIDVTYYPYYQMSGYEDKWDIAYTLVLSQPVRQGEGGIWCVDRWYDDHGSGYYAIPEIDVTMAEHYAALQAACDRGERDDLLDPVQVALAFEEDWSGRDLQPGAFTAGAVYEDGAADARSLSLTGPAADLWGDGGGRITLSLEQQEVYRSYTVPVAEGNGAAYLNYADSNFTWTALDSAPDPYPEGGWSVEAAVESGYRLCFWQDAPYVRCSSQAGEQWYQLEPLSDDPWGLSGTMRHWFDEAEFEANLSRCAVVTDSGQGLDTVALQMGQAMAAALERNTAGSIFAVEAAQCDTAAVTQTDPKNSDIFICDITLALDMDPEESVGFHPGAGVSAIETGAHAGWWAWSHEVVLTRQRGVWQIVEWSSGGVRLEDYL